MWQFFQVWRLVRIGSKPRIKVGTVGDFPTWWWEIITQLFLEHIRGKQIGDYRNYHKEVNSNCHVVSKIIRPFGSFAPSQTYDTDQVVSNWTSSGFGSPTRLWLWAWTQKNKPKIQKEKHTNIAIQCITFSIFSRLLLQSSCTSRPISRSTRIPNCWTYQHAKRLTPNQQALAKTQVVWWFPQMRSNMMNMF